MTKGANETADILTKKVKEKKIRKRSKARKGKKK